MKPTISIFVSGAKSLKEHRMRLKVLANDMNGEFRKKGIDIILNMYSYLNFGDNQKEYDDFIKNKADIVMFIFEGRMGDKTREEFLLASETFKKDGSPKPYVFLKEFEERTPQIDEIEQMVNAHSSSYYIEYSNLEDLVSKVRRRLQQEVNERLDKQNVTPEKKVRKYKYMAIASILALLTVIGIGFYSVYKQSKEVILLFAGGGSASNCLKIQHEEVGDIYTYENAISIGMPTSVAWALVSAEILHHHAYKSDKVQKPFYPVCLSAKEAKESDFLKLCDREQFVKNGSVLSVFLGNDRLMVYIKKNMDNEFVHGKDSIRADELAGLIHLALEKNYEIFSTQEGSGTLLSYRDILSPQGVEITKEYMGELLQWYSQSTPSNKIRKEEHPYIILGSEYYVAWEVYDEGDCRRLVVVDENNQSLKKPAYLYFAGYNHDVEGSTFWIPDEMVEFLRKLDPRYGDLIKNNIIPRKTEMIIVPLDEYLKK